MGDTNTENTTTETVNQTSTSTDAASLTEAAKTYTEAELEAAKQQLRADFAKEQKQLEKEAKQREAEAQLSESEQHKRRAEELEARLRERDGRDAFEREAKASHAANPQKIYRLYKDEIEYDDKGQATNLKEIVAAARKDFPEEFGAAQGSADAGAGRTSGQARGGSMNDFIRRATGRS